jgi:hypothetical protein
LQATALSRKKNTKKIPPRWRDFTWFEKPFSNLTACFEKLSTSRGKNPTTIKIVQWINDSLFVYFKGVRETAALYC